MAVVVGDVPLGILTLEVDSTRRLRSSGLSICRRRPCFSFRRLFSRRLEACCTLQASSSCSRILKTPGHTRPRGTQVDRGCTTGCRGYMSRRVRACSFIQPGVSLVNPHVSQRKRSSRKGPGLRILEASGVPVGSKRMASGK